MKQKEKIPEILLRSVEICREKKSFSKAMLSLGVKGLKAPKRYLEGETCYWTFGGETVKVSDSPCQGVSNSEYIELCGFAYCLNGFDEKTAKFDILRNYKVFSEEDLKKKNVNINEKLEERKRFTNRTVLLKIFYFIDDKCFTSNMLLNGHWPDSSIISNWVYNKDLIGIDRNAVFLQSSKELTSLLYKINPYAKNIREYIGPYSYTISTNNEYIKYVAALLLWRPELEILIKANYAFAKTLLSSNCITPTEASEYNRLCNRCSTGSPKEIFKTSKRIYTLLKNESNLTIWDQFRKMDKTMDLSIDDFRQIYYHHYDQKILKSMNSILKATYDGKPIFTMSKLLNYLGRLDMYEAIGEADALILITDYLKMCRGLGIKPNFLGDSLKREHDVTARNYSAHKNEIISEKIEKYCKINSNYNYEGDEEDPFFIRSITDYDDLILEANMQRNCVACYAEDIANGSSKIYTMREKQYPNRSLITIELSPSNKLRQRYLSSNRPVENPNQLHFIKKWMNWIKQKDK